MIKVASLRYGVIFKKAFSQPQIFTAFVKDFAGVDIEIDHVETEKSFSPVIGKVDSHFDLFAEDKKNRIIVDIQHKRFTDHYDRFLHYHCAALLEQISDSYNYTTNMRVFTIVVLTSGDYHKTDIAITDFEPKDLQGKGIGETQHKIIYICPKYSNKNTPAPYREWLRAINDSLDGEVNETSYQNQAIHEIFNLIKKDNTTPQEYARMKDEYANEEYIRNKSEKAERKGIKKGIQKGIQQEKQENVKMMLKEGIEVKLIAKITGFSVQEIDKFSEI